MNYMKLNKRKLISTIKRPLEEMGYTFFKTSDGLIIFGKKVQDNLLLTLGFTIHRFYDDQFAADFYLSPTTYIYNTSFDIPIDSIARIGMLLTHEERKIYADEKDIEPHKRNESILLEFPWLKEMEKSIPEYAWCKKNPEGQDCWWQGLNEESVKRFLGAIKIAETRFISDIDMITRINRSKEVERLYNEQEKVISYLGRISEFDNYQFIPTKCLCAPIEWYKAAELLCRESVEYSINTVRDLGENAYRVYVLRNDLTPKEK